MSQSQPSPSDLVGYLWEEAEQRLQASGLRYETRLTAPPNRPVGVGPLRVVAARPLPDQYLILLAHREYQRLAPDPDSQPASQASGR